MNKMTINDIPLKGRSVFIRVDFNVPLDDQGHIVEDTRIRASLPTINHAIDEGARIILASHLGRPRGGYNPSLSLKQVQKRLERLLDQEVLWAEDCLDPELPGRIEEMKSGQVMLLENLRFHKEEQKNDEDFARRLASLCDVYVNDAFGAAHRAHASTYGMATFAPLAVGGFLMKKEVDYFNRMLASPDRPLVAVLGGAKISGKIGILKNLIEKVDKVAIGGGMMYTFLKAKGYEIGKSLVEDEMLPVAEEIMLRAGQNHTKFYLPVDAVVAERFDIRSEKRIVPVQEIPEGWVGMDIGPATIKLFAEVIQDVRTIIWNGPMGVFEMDPFSRGTFAMARAIADTYALSIVGGGDTDVAVHLAGESYNMSYISTGGGAFLKLLEGFELPGVVALNDRASGEEK
jgi:phosphoglycerate kinase